MTLRERHPNGEKIIYQDEEGISRAKLAQAFGCSSQAIDRLFTRGKIQPETILMPDKNIKTFMKVGDFPRLIGTIQNSQNGRAKLKSGPEDTTGTFVAETVKGVVFTYTPPRQTSK